DLAKVEAGKLEVKAKSFEVGDLFGALRGMLKPLLAESSLNLVFGAEEDLPTQPPGAASSRPAAVSACRAARQTGRRPQSSWPSLPACRPRPWPGRADHPPSRR